MKMMHALLVSLSLLVAPGLADAKRPEPITDEERTIVQVYEAPGFTKDQLYTTARMWIAQNFKSAKAVIEYENKDEGTIIGNGNIPFPCKGFDCLGFGDTRVPFTMKVETKDGKIRITFTNINMAWPASYNGGIPIRAADGPVRQRRHYEAIKPELLKMGDQIVASAGQVKTDSNW